jgi:Tol biopolymer transport system component
MTRRQLGWRFLLLFWSLSAFIGVHLRFPLSAAEQPQVKLLLAFASYRERPRHPKIYFYEHDGASTGKIIGSIDAVNQRSDYHPSLSHDGRYCAFASELENQTGRIQLWDVKEKKLVDLPALNDSPNAQMSAALAGDGKLLAFTAWNRPGASQRWDIFLYDVTAKKLLDLPNLNTQTHDERMPALSGDGRFLAFTSNAKGGVGLTDVYLYDRKESKFLALPEMNSKHMDVEPSLSADGQLIAFVSDRPGGSGGRDIYLYDRAAGKLLPLPGLNSTAHEQSPSLSPDGRFLAFVSERIGGEGERDLYLYDRQTQKLLPTPGLNAKQEDLDPCVIVLKVQE